MTKVVKTAENWYTVTNEFGVVISDCHPSYGSAVRTAMKIDDIFFEIANELYEKRENALVSDEQVAELESYLHLVSAQAYAAAQRLRS